MSDSHAAKTDELPAQQAMEAGGSPGREIRQARERLGISLDELAAQTRLARATLGALESDDFQTLVEPVYVRGYYRKCAKVLHLPEESLIAAYVSMVAPKAPAYAPPKLLLSSEGSKSGWLRRSWLLVLALLVFIAAAFFALQSHYGSAPESPGTPTAAGSTGAETSDSSASDSPPLADMTAGPDAEPAAANSAATAQIPPDPQTAATVPAPVKAAETAPAKSKTPGVSAPETSHPASTAPAASDAAGPPPADALILQFRQTSWVRVEDSSGHLLLSGLIPSGARQTLVGHLPYSVFLGNAPGVTAEFNGKPLDVTAVTHQNSTARFSVPQAAVSDAN